MDSGVYSDYVIPPYYDSMLAKLIVWEEDREKALLRMERALSEFIIKGVKTTIPFHLKILNNAYFRRGDYNTNFINRRLKTED